MLEFLWYYYIFAAQITTKYEFTLDALLPYNKNNWSNFIAFEANTTNGVFLFSNNKSLIIEPNDKFTFVYYTLIPIDICISNGWYLQGELNKWIRVSRQRFQYIDINENGVKAELIGVEDENVLIGFISYVSMEQKVISCVFNQSISMVIDCVTTNVTLECTCV